MLCKCSGKYIDIYFILKITYLCLYCICSIFFFFNTYISITYATLFIYFCYFCFIYICFIFILCLYYICLIYLFIYLLLLLMFILLMPQFLFPYFLLFMFLLHMPHNLCIYFRDITCNFSVIYLLSAWKKIFLKDIVFSCVCDFVLFYFIVFYLFILFYFFFSTQQLLKGSTNPNQIFTHDF